MLGYVTGAVRDHAPPVLHSMAITAYNSGQLHRRRSGPYRQWRGYYGRWWSAPPEQWQAEQERRLRAFLEFVQERSPYYRQLFAGARPRRVRDLADIPPLTKDDLREHFDDIITLPPSKGFRISTGGTTGASLQVVFRRDDYQERWAALDDFRSRFGYQLGARTAWFGGRDLLPQAREQGPFHRDNYLRHIRFFSTFHINERTFDSNWRALTDLRPQFLIGYPSSVYDLCYPAYERGVQLPTPARAFFASAETLVPDQVRVIEHVLGCRVVDQYASSEGAPFIVECVRGRMHIHPLTGVFEIQPDGELLVTTFHTRGTPLVRYRIGDRITLAERDEDCGCGCTFPVVARIEGRASDYLLSPTHGRCYLANVSTCTKGVSGVVRFQAVQEVIDRVDVAIVPGSGFTDTEGDKLVAALQRRLGPQMTITWSRVPEIPAEASGKQRLVKNLLAG